MSGAPTVQILNGHLIDPANGIDQPSDLFLANGQVHAVGKPPKGFKAEITLDAAGLVVCPGLVDLCAHLREPGEEHKATIKSETTAAARSGITTLCCPPDTDPVIDTAAVATLIYRRAQAVGKTRVLPIGALTKGLDGEHLSEMAALQQARCAGLSNARRPMISTLVERRALEYAATFGITVMVAPEDSPLAAGGCAHEGPVSTRLGLPAIPAAAETVAVAQHLVLAAHTGCHIHFRGLSTGEAVEMIRRARAENLPVSADVSAHQLHLTEDDLAGFNSNCHVAPPLRSARDRELLRAGVAEGVIGAICSDHQPHEPDAKEAPFPSTAPGISALETLLPLTLALVNAGILTLPQAIARLTAGPAAILGLPVGNLEPGATADLCIFDPKAVWTLNAAEMRSRGHNTPFLGREFTGRVSYTLLEGRIVYRQDAS
jgi:dihydroorotase